MQGLASMQVFKRLRHALPGQCAHIQGFCLLEERGHIGRFDRLVGKLLLKAPKTKRREH